jgi:hypothetical protein
MRLARSYADFRKNVENRARLYFQLFREIVDSNLTHPPLFNVCRQMALKNSSRPHGPFLLSCPLSKYLLLYA